MGKHENELLKSLPILFGANRFDDADYISRYRQFV